MRLTGYRGASARAATLPPSLWLPFGDATKGLSAATDATALGTQAGSANRLDLHPLFLNGGAARIKSLGVAVSTAVASALARAVIYEQDRANPARLVHMLSSADLDCSSVGAKKSTVDFTFRAGGRYFVGVHQSSTATLRALALAALWPIASSLNSTTQFTVLRYTQTYASGPPGELTVNVAAMQSTTASAVLMEWY